MRNDRESYRKPNTVELIIYVCLIIFFIVSAIFPPATGTMLK